MRTTEYLRRSEARIARAEAACHATILRALHRVLSVLRREQTEYAIRMDRAKRGVRR